jgi:hypothetical protein
VWKLCAGILLFSVIFCEKVPCCSCIAHERYDMHGCKEKFLGICSMHDEKFMLLEVELDEDLSKRRDLSSFKKMWLCTPFLVCAWKSKRRQIGYSKALLIAIE